MGEQSIPVQQRAALLEARAEKKGFVGRTLADLEKRWDWQEASSVSLCAWAGGTV